MFLGLLIGNYILTILFLKSFYLLYFAIVFTFIYFAYKAKYKNNIYHTLVNILIILLTPFLFELFDEFVYELYLYFDLDSIYISVGSLVTYILSAIHAIVFFSILSYNRKIFL